MDVYNLLVRFQEEEQLIYDDDIREMRRLISLYKVSDKIYRQYVRQSLDIVRSRFKSKKLSVGGILIEYIGSESNAIIAAGVIRDTMLRRTIDKLDLITLYLKYSPFVEYYSEYMTVDPIFSINLRLTDLESLLL